MANGDNLHTRNGAERGGDIHRMTLREIGDLAASRGLRLMDILRR